MRIVNRHEFDFLLDWLELDALLARPRFEGHSTEDVAAILTLIQQLAENEVAPHLRSSDVEEPRLLDDGTVTVLPAAANAVRQIAEAGLFSAIFDRDLGGLQLPHLVYTAAMGMLMSGNIATPTFLLLTVSNARLIAAFGTPAQIDAFASPQIAGRTLGTMCLSESHAGSSLGDLRTRAVEEGQDQYGRRFRVSGSKMWISAGDHDITGNIIHLVLAKIPDADGRLPPGTKGISLFIVPKILPDGERNDVVVVGLNHKLGYRGLPNCAFNLGEGHAAPHGTHGAIGWLVGEPGQGMPQMFQMMNEARVAIGLGAAALASRGYLMALDYARERTQGRMPGVGDGDQIPIIGHADVRRMLLAQKCYAEGALALVFYSARLLDDEQTAPTGQEREDAAALLALLTPVAKSFPAEWAQESLNLALQIHGGAGYTRDFEIEQLYRDNRLNSIHEGTTGIQAVDLVGRKIRRENGRTIKRLHGMVEAAVARGLASAHLAESSEHLAEAWSDIMSAAERLMAEPDDRKATAHATAFLFAFGHAVVGWLWLDQAIACEAKLAAEQPADAPFLRGKQRAWQFFADAELPKIAAWLAPIMSGADIILTMNEDEF